MDERQLKQIADILSRCIMPVAFTGAGISAESGVPTFRDNNGLWDGYDPMKVATPESFRENPKSVWQFYNERRKQVKQVQPNPAHLALAELESIHGNLLIITQNIDGLHQQAGSKNIIELHGSLFKARCTQCDYQTEIDKPEREILSEILSDEPTCPKCFSLLRPSVVWFYEPLPEDEFSSTVEAADSCDVMLSIGTSAEVHPAASLIWQAKANGAIVIEINPKPTAASNIANICIRESAGKALPKIVEYYKSKNNR